MSHIFVSFLNGYKLFCRNRIHGLPVEKCDIENFKRIQEKGIWLKGSTLKLPELHYFNFFQYPQTGFPGLSIIRATEKKIEIDPNYSYFLGDFMTTDGINIVDIANLSENETKILAEEILNTFDYFDFVVVKPGQILAWFPGKYPYFDWKHPCQLIGLNYRECLPKGGSFRTPVRVIENSFRLLEKHPVNRVRIDLGENPANFLWFHSQNKNVEKIIPLPEKTQKKALYWSDSNLLNDIALYIGFEITNHIPVDQKDSIVWINITTQSNELISLMRACEFIDKEILGNINHSANRLVIEFNDGFYNTKNALYLLYPKEGIGFFNRFQLLKKTPGFFLLN